MAARPTRIEQMSDAAYEQPLETAFSGTWTFQIAYFRSQAQGRPDQRREARIIQDFPINCF